MSAIARALGTHRAGIYRLLAPLVEQRLLLRADDGRFTLGTGLIELASRVRPRLQEIAAPELRRLADELGATTALTLRDGDEAVVAAVVEPRSTDAHLAYRSGLRHPLDRGAPGLAMLAAGPPAPGERPEVAETRHRGWALSSGELIAGATGVAAAVRDAGGEAVAAVSAVWIAPRVASEAAERVVAVARTIESRLRG